MLTTKPGRLAAATTIDPWIGSQVGRRPGIFNPAGHAPRREFESHPIHQGRVAKRSTARGS